MSMHWQQSRDELAARCGRVAVLMGGDSAEREVSLNSGAAVHAALCDAGVDAFAVDLESNAFHQLAELKADRVFNVLHGRGGEDGTVRAASEIFHTASSCWHEGGARLTASPPEKRLF